jgi:hypothetical protein
MSHRPAQIDRQLDLPGLLPPRQKPSRGLREILAGFYWNVDSRAAQNGAPLCCDCFKALRLLGDVNLPLYP